MNGSLHIGIDWICMARVRANYCLSSVADCLTQLERELTLVVKVRIGRPKIGFVKVKKLIEGLTNDGLMCCMTTNGRGKMG